MRNIFYIIGFIIFYGQVGLAQDIHFSQYQHTPLWVNPAFAGQTQGDMRLIANYRNQWSSVTVPYQTMALSYDTRIPKYFGRSCSYFGGGILLMNDQAGDSEFRTTTAQLALAYHQSLSKKGKPSYLSLGVNVGGTQMGLKPDKLYFDNQFNGEGFDTGLSNGEVLDRTSFFYLDISAGLNFSIALGKKSGISLGVGAYHLNQPNVSFLGDSAEKLYSRLVVQGSGVISINEDFPISFIPSLVFMAQGPHQEFTSSLLLKWSASEEFSLYLGAGYRGGDAFIPMLRIDYKTVALAVSYDLNSSDLSKVSNSNGGMEVSLLFQPNIFNEKQDCQSIFCPW